MIAYWIGILVIGSTAAAGEGAAIRGQLVDKLEGTPIVGAVVQLDGSEPVCVSDEQGRFHLEGIPPGRHRLKVIDPAYAPFERALVIRKGEQLELHFALDPSGAQEQEELVIRSRRQAAETSRTELEMQQVEKVPGTQGDIVKIVESLPGVARTSVINTSKVTTTRLGGAVVRGAAPEDSQVQIDGHPVPLLYHFGGLKSVIHTEMLGRIDFLPGAFGAEHGYVLGGVVDVHTRPCRAERWGGYAELGMLDAGFYLAGPLAESLAVAVAGRRSTLDAWLPHVMPDEPGLALTLAPAYYDYQARLDWSPTASHRLSVLVFGAYDELSFLHAKPLSGDPSLRGDLDYWIHFHKLVLGWLFAPGSDWQLGVSLAGGLDEEHLAIFTHRFFERSSPSVSLRADGRYRVTEELELRAGLGGSLDFYTSRHRFPRPAKEGEVAREFSMFELVEGDERMDLARAHAYLLASWRPMERMALDAGLRLELYAAPVERWALMPRSSLSFRLRPGTELGVAAGLHAQAPQLDEISEQFGRRGLELERAWHFALALDQRLPARFRLHAEAFYKLLDDLVVLDSELVYTNAGMGKVAGLELLLAREGVPDEGCFGWLAYSLMRSLRRDAPGQPWRLFDFDQTHILTLVAGYRLPGGEANEIGLRGGWEFGLRFQLVSGNPYTPMTGGIFDADFDTHHGVPGPVNSGRMPLYHRLDLRVDYTFAFVRWALVLYLDVQNVYNHCNVEAVDYNYDYTEQAWLRGLPVLPFLGIQARF
ncbi:MAG: TonB-dependent receptor [Deltaproteobacteria bacterium]|nr:TonB-dependent receptor [Deltaproteobacteria bacterium]